MMSRCQSLLSNSTCAATQRLRTVLQTAIHLHVALEAPISKARVRVLAQSAELLQAILSAYNRKKTEVLLEAGVYLCGAVCVHALVEYDKVRQTT
jgi:hypothetical protein